MRLIAWDSARLPSDIHTATGIDLTETDIWLHHFNVRGLIVKENTCAGGIPLPAITAGVHFKVNGNIEDVNQELGGGTVLPTIGYRDSSGIDYTLTATKTIPPDVLGRPLILTAGLRLSEASQLGILGFGDSTARRSRAAWRFCRWIACWWPTSSARKRTPTGRSQA